METHTAPANPDQPGKIKRVYRWLFTWQRVRRTLVALVILAALGVIVYAAENRRGRRAWENCRRELEANGEVLDWNKFVPESIPDDQNIFKAPKMTEWFVKASGQNSQTKLSERLSNSETTATITNREAAVAYLAWSDRQADAFEIIRAGLKRPQARIDCDYRDPVTISIPNFVSLRYVAQVLAQRARCHLLLNQPGEAASDLTLIFDLRRLLNGSPITLVAAMINVAITGLYLDVVGEGIQQGAWTETERAVLETQLAQIQLPPLLPAAFRTERASISHIWVAVRPKIGAFFGWDSSGSRWKNYFEETRLFVNFAPSGWHDLNLVAFCKTHQLGIGIYDSEHQVMIPQRQKAAEREVERRCAHPWPDGFLSALVFPNFAKACQVTARNQTKVDQARVVFALEKYRAIHGEYPQTLAALVPQFIANIPHDVIGGQPLKYQRTPDGQFLLYSIGWNETDDGGKAAFRKDGGSIAYDQGDWVWGTPAR